MKIEDLPFLIGEQYENWEFELEILPDRIKGMDSYKYIGKEIHKFLNYIPVQSELIFDLDILECVVLVFEDENIFSKLINELLQFDSLNNHITLFLRDKNVNVLYGSAALIKQVKRGSK